MKKAGLKIIAAIKQVPDTAEVRIDPATNTLVRQGIPTIMNPEDRHALEAALGLREAHGGIVTALSMGPPQAEDVLVEALAMGADRGVLLSDRAFAGSDTLITAFSLSRAVMKLGAYDLILCGRQAIDGDTAQVGPQLAGFLGIPQVTYARQIRIAAGTIAVVRSLEDCSELVRTRLPALVTVTSEINQPRHPSLYNLERACDGSCLMRWTAQDLRIPEAMLGLPASPTGVRRIFEPDHKNKGEVISGDERQMARALIEKLKGMHVL
jgi:electron transfer flavoprotein beta subunit